jgi:phytoene synthase
MNYLSDQDKEQKLKAWSANWEKAYQQKTSDDPALAAVSEVFHKYKIPYEYSESFLAAMLSDTKKKRYENYQELKEYMYGSAAVVGLMMSYVIGFTDKRALVYAEELGYAMQLTNFLRDIKEDYHQRDRIYLPLAELKQFGLEEKDISSEKFSKNFIDFMKFQISRADAFYESAAKGVYLLNRHGHAPVKLALVLYREILRKIEDQGYNIFKKRAHTNLLEKILLIKEAV